MSNRSKSSSSSWSSEDILNLLSTIHISNPIKPSEQSTIEQHLCQTLQSEFNFGKDADLQLYSDLAHIFVHWRIRVDHGFTLRSRLKNVRDGGGNRSGTNGSGEVGVVTTGKDGQDEDDEDNDSDLSIGSSHHSSNSTGLNQMNMNETATGTTAARATSSCSNNTTNPKHHPMASSGERIHHNTNEMDDSDVEEDYLSANDSSEIDEVLHYDDEEEDRAYVAEQMSTMKIDPASSTSSSSSSNGTNHQQASTITKKESKKTISNNLLKEFELMGRHMNETNNDPTKNPKKRGKENDPPLSSSSSSSVSSPSFVDVGRGGGVDDSSSSDHHFTSSFQQIHIHDNGHHVHNVNAETVSTTSTAGCKSNENNDAKFSFDKKQSSNANVTTQTQSVQQENNVEGQTKIDSSMKNTARNTFHAAAAAAAKTSPPPPPPPRATTTPYSEPKQYIGLNVSFGSEFFPPFEDESSDSDFFSTPGEEKTKEQPQQHEEEKEIEQQPQQQHQPPPPPPPTNPSPSSFSSSQQSSQPFNSIFGMNTKTELKFNVDLKRSKSNTRRGSPRVRRSKFKKSGKKTNSTSSSQSMMDSSATTAAASTNASESGIHFDLNVPPSNVSNVDTTDNTTQQSTTTTPVADMKNIHGETPKAMDIDTPQFPAPPQNNFEGQVFTIGIGGGTPSKKHSHSLRRNRSSVKAKSIAAIGSASLRNSVKSKAPTPEKTKMTKAQPKFTSTYENLEKETRNKALQTKLESIRNEAKTLYSSESYHESVRKFTDAIILLTDDFKHIPKPLKKPEESETLASIYGNRAAALMMVGAYNAASVDCTKGIAHLQGYNPLAMKVENEADIMSYFKPDGGLILMSKLSARMCRAHMKLGNIDQAEIAIKETIRISEIAVKCHQRILAHASQKGLHVPAEVMQSSERVLVHCKSNATLNKNDLQKMKEQIDAINSIGGVVKDTETRLARKRSIEIFPRIEEILKIAPSNIEMQESKVMCLASMRRWPELMSYCESLAQSNSSANSVYIADLRSIDPFPDLVSTINLNMRSGRQLNSKEVAYATKWIPRHKVAPLYVRALRLEERYLEASKACDSLSSLSGMDEPVWSPIHKKEKKFEFMVQKELQKINKTMLMKEEGDKFYREGNYNKAADMYASVLLIDSEQANFFAQEPWECETAGGRLHAVLHCNRAACLMAVKKFEEAAKECSAALRIQKKYMKAMLRRARCYARMERYEESISEYNKWSGLVQEARANSHAKIDDECMFDRPGDITDSDHQRVMSELAEVMKMKSNKDEIERQAKENARRRASSAFDRRQKWYEHQEGNGPRRWDSFNGSSPKKDNNRYSRTSSFRTNRYGSQSRSNSSHRQSKKDVDRPSPGSSSVTCHYAVLQINSTASQNDIKKAYHKLALKYHPDKNKKDSAAEVFRKVKLAYETLSDERQRRLYDVERLRSSTRRRF